MAQEEQTYGLIASFKDTPEFFHAAEKVSRRWLQEVGHLFVLPCPRNA